MTGSPISHSISKALANGLPRRTLSPAKRAQAPLVVSGLEYSCRPPPAAGAASAGLSAEDLLAEDLRQEIRLAQAVTLPPGSYVVAALVCPAACAGGPADPGPRSPALDAAPPCSALASRLTSFRWRFAAAGCGAQAHAELRSSGSSDLSGAATPPL